MRQIVFRGKRAATDEWMYGGFCSRFDKAFIVGCSKTLRFDGCELRPETVGQFTGLIDRNGEGIFEGDIVRGLFLFGMAINAVVVFQDGAFGLKWRRGQVEMFQAFTSFCNVEFEVIGNIHDNPDMYPEGVMTE